MALIRFDFVQDYFTYAKVFALIVIICTGVYFLSQGNTANFSWEGTETDITVIGKKGKNREIDWY